MVRGLGTCTSDPLPEGEVPSAQRFGRTQATIISEEHTGTVANFCTLLGVEAPEPPALSLVPNPSTVCRLKCGEHPTAPVQVLDPADRVVDVPVRWSAPTQAELDLARLAPGVYTVRVQANGAWTSARRVKP